MKYLATTLLESGVNIIFFRVTGTRIDLFFNYNKISVLVDQED